MRLEEKITGPYVIVNGANLTTYMAASPAEEYMLIYKLEEQVELHDMTRLLCESVLFSRAFCLEFWSQSECYLQTLLRLFVGRC
ncbi:hypothetical protein EAE96_004613 [Botrytis aclada]|nr:hypothetical protein EAE96_004613 [Botrytis aclada]